MRNVPLFGHETGGLLKVICPMTKAKYFFEKDWTGESPLTGLMKFDFWRKWNFAQISAIDFDGSHATRSALSPLVGEPRRVTPIEINRTDRLWRNGHTRMKSKSWRCA